MQNNSLEAFRRNLSLLMLEQNLKYSDFDSRRSGISGRYVRKIMQDGLGIRLEKLDIIANFLGVTSIALLNPNMKIESASPENLQKLVDAYLASSSKSQEFIMTVAERETERS